MCIFTCILFHKRLFLLQVVAFILIGVAVYGKASALVTNLPIIGGILACGVILILISILGLIGAVKHHQVLLFFVSFSARSRRSLRLKKQELMSQLTFTATSISLAFVIEK